MVSTFIFFSDEAIEESKQRIKSLNYILSPNGGLMTSVCIPPVNNLFLHLTDTFKSDSIVITYEDLVSNTSKEKVDSELKNMYNKAFKINLKDGEIESWIENGSSILLVIDQKENILGCVNVRNANINHLDEKDSIYNLFVNTENFVFLSDLISTKKGIGRTLMNHVIYNMAVGNDIILKAANKQLVGYYEQYDFTLLVSEMLNGNVMVRRG